LEGEGGMRMNAVMASLLVVMAGGCSSGSNSTGGGADAAVSQVTITFLRHDNQAYVRADKAFFAEYMAAHPGVTIADTTVDFRTLASTLNGDLTRDQFTYDLVLIPPSRMCGYRDHLTDVPENVITLAAAQTTFFAAPLAGSTCDGHLKGLPVEYNLEYGGVVVNLDKYHARFMGRTPAWSRWSDFIAEAAALTEHDAQGVPRANGLDIDPVWPPATWELLLAQILQRGGDYWASPAHDAFNFHTQAAHDGLTEMVNWITVDKVMYPDLVPPSNTYVTTRLAAGATGFGWSDPLEPLAVIGYVGTWGVTSAHDQLPAGASWQFEYIPLPPMVGTEHKFVQDSGWAFAVPRTSKHPEVAWDIARSLALSPEQMRKWSATTGALPALQVNGSRQAAASDPTLAKVQPLLEKGQWLGFIPTAAFETVQSAFVNNYFAAAAGTKTIDQALSDLESTANTAIAEHIDD
jgi:multiple sugar transport system substrate-binding protein